MLIEDPVTTVESTATREPMTEADAARRLGLKVATLRAWRHHGRGPAFLRLGRAIRYRPIDIDEFMNANRQCPAAVDA